MRSSRFQSFSPPLRTSGLRRLKTAFSPSSSTSSNSSRSYSMASSSTYPSSSSSTSTTSPLSSSLETYCFDEANQQMHSESLTSSPSSGCCSSVGEETAIEPNELPGKFTAMLSTRSRLRTVLQARRRRPSVWHLRIEEERRTFSAGLSMFEPRPKDVDVHIGGIFEVLEGRA